MWKPNTRTVKALFLLGVALAAIFGYALSPEIQSAVGEVINALGEEGVLDE